MPLKTVKAIGTLSCVPSFTMTEDTTMTLLNRKDLEAQRVTLADCTEQNALDIADSMLRDTWEVQMQKLVLMFFHWPKLAAATRIVLFERHKVKVANLRRSRKREAARESYKRCKLAVAQRSTAGTSNGGPGPSGGSACSNTVINGTGSGIETTLAVASVLEGFPELVTKEEVQVAMEDATDTCRWLVAAPSGI